MLVNADAFKSALSKSMKGAARNKLLPITEFVAMRNSDKSLSLFTTDGTNYVEVKIPIISLEDDVDGFYAVVPVEKLYKLVTKFGSGNVALKRLSNNKLCVNYCHSTYEIECSVDETGEMVNYPNPMKKFMKEFFGEKLVEISKSMVDVIANTCKSSLAMTVEEPVYTNYFVGKDSVIATDTYKICSIETNLIDDTKLFSSALVDLLTMFDKEKIFLAYNDQDEYLFSDNPADFYSMRVFGHFANGVDEYAADEIKALVNSSFAHTCAVKRSELLSALDRIALFVGVYDNKAITLRFDAEENRIVLDTVTGNGYESIDFIEPTEDDSDFTCSIDVDMFTQQVKAYAGDSVNISYGLDGSIKLQDGKVTQIIALLEE